MVPATSFTEPNPRKDVNGKVPKVWFALDDSEPLFVFAGIWTAWGGVRKVKKGPVEVELYGFLTTQPNTVVKPIHEKAMPVILRSQDEIDTWLSAPVEAALKLQRPLPDDVLRSSPRPRRSGTRQPPCLKRRRRTSSCRCSDTANRGSRPTK